MNVKVNGFIWAAAMGLALMFCGLAHAAMAGKVDGVQMPAWLDRGGLSVPVSPGLALQAGDTLRTGAGARLLLKLEEGSLVKLGENARFTIEKAQPAKGGVYEAAFSVVNGAFRFTTEVLSKNMPRDVTINVGQNATIGVRGTDLWGRSNEGKDIVCLIEGKIEVTGNDRKALVMDRPLHFFQSTRTAPPEPLGFLPADQLNALAAETELEFSKSASTLGGWKVIIDGFASRDASREAARSLRINGYPAEVGAENTLIIAKMDSELSARQLAVRLKVGSAFKEVRIAQ
ncbi:MAG: FecR family protein [Betaproteobacteria bacterium]